MEYPVEPHHIEIIIYLTTAYSLRSADITPEPTGDLLTITSERVVKKLTLESLTNTPDNTNQYIETMPNNVHDSAMMVCYRECLSNLEKFNGGEEKKVLQFVNNIERIGKMIDANDDILHCMCTAKLDGEAKRWYEDNMSLNQWEHFKSALLERFNASDTSSKVFEQLKERKQQIDESITAYYDAVMKLCREYDPSMSQKMMISWLENGIKDSLKLPIKRQMKLLSETARTTQAFLKIAKDEQELQEEHPSGFESTASYQPFFTNTVSTTLPQTEDGPPDWRNYSRPSRATSHQTRTQYQPQKNSYGSNQQAPRTTHSPTHQRPYTARPSSTFHNNVQQFPSRNMTSFDSRDTKNTRKFKPCQLCQRDNYRTIDCYHKKPYGCYKCGQSEHRIRDCPEVFC